MNHVKAPDAAPAGGAGALMLKYAEKIRVHLSCDPGTLPARYCEACWKKRAADAHPLLAIPMVVQTGGSARWRSICVGGRHLATCPACCSLVDAARLRVTHPSLHNAWSCGICNTR